MLQKNNVSGNVWPRAWLVGRLLALAVVWPLSCFSAAVCFAQSTYSENNAGMSNAFVLSQRNGRVDVVTGDLLWIGIHKIKLDGIATLKSSHHCSLNGRDQRCARRMRERLAGFAQHDDFRCELILTQSGRPKFSHGGRYAALCFTGDTEINQELVARGWALAEAGSSGRRYRAVEAAARARKLGVHQYTYEDPRTPRATGFGGALRRLMRRYPFIFFGGLSVICALLLMLLVAMRWRARQQIAQLKYDLGKVQGILETTAKPLPPRPQPIKNLEKR